MLDSHIPRFAFGGRGNPRGCRCWKDCTCLNDWDKLPYLLVETNSKIGRTYAGDEVFDYICPTWRTSPRRGRLWHPLFVFSSSCGSEDSRSKFRLCHVFSPISCLPFCSCFCWGERRLRFLGSPRCSSRDANLDFRLSLCTTALDLEGKVVWNQLCPGSHLPASSLIHIDESV